MGNPKRDVYNQLHDDGLLEYGSVILGSRMRGLIGIEYPKVGTKEQFTDLALTELTTVDYIRNILLGHGKYLSQSNGDYRVLLPSENARQCELYIRSASKKLNRSLKLSRNTPPIDGHDLDNLSVRALMQQESLKRV